MPGHARAVEGGEGSATVQRLTEKENVMSCFICEGEARTIPSIGDYEERVCPDCGHYRVSGTVVAQLETLNRKFDVDQMKLFVQGGIARGEIPLITSYVAYLH
jgi:hypothetical protein